MLGRKNYTPQEVESARAAIDRQLAAYGELTRSTDPGEFEPASFNNLLLALDRFFVHRLRVVAGKDGNPLNEVELIVEALLAGDGVLRTKNAVKYKPEESVLGLEPGDRIALTAGDFERLYQAFMAELEARFVGAATPT
jgi:hypothetical protein